MVCNFLKIKGYHIKRFDIALLESAIQNLFKEGLMKTFWRIVAMMLFVVGLAFADAPTDFASAIPSTLIPDGFWQLVGVVFTAVATVWGITKGIRLFKKA